MDQGEECGLASSGAVAGRGECGGGRKEPGERGNWPLHILQHVHLILPQELR